MPKINESLSQGLCRGMKNGNLHSPLVHVVLRVVQPHPDLDGVALPDEVEDVLHDAPEAGAGDQVSSDVFPDVMS